MEIRYTPSVKDLSAFQRYWIRYQNRAVWGGRATGIAGLALIVVLLLLLIYLVVPIEWLPGLLRTLGFYVLVLVLLLAGGWMFVQRQLRRALPGEVRVSLHEDGLHHTDVETRCVTRWDKIEHVGATDDHVFVVFGYNRGLVIPRSAIGGPDAVGPFLAELRQRVPDRTAREAAR